MQELRPGLWWWEAEHPEWGPEDAATEDWVREVSSYAIDAATRLLLIDPTGAAGSRRGHGRPPRGGDRADVPMAPARHPRPDGAVRRDGAHAAVDDGDPDPLPGLVFRAGERLPIGIEARPGMEPNDLVLWIEGQGALVAGDTLIDRGNGLEFPADWANKGVPPEQIMETLQPLLDLPVELVLPTHGAPADRAALERALS